MHSNYAALLFIINVIKTITSVERPNEWASERTNERRNYHRWKMCTLNRRKTTNISYRKLDAVQIYSVLYNTISSVCSKFIYYLLLETCKCKYCNNENIIFWQAPGIAELNNVRIRINNIQWILSRSRYPFSISDLWQKQCIFMAHFISE